MHDSLVQEAVVPDELSRKLGSARQGVFICHAQLTCTMNDRVWVKQLGAFSDGDFVTFVPIKNAVAVTLCRGLRREILFLEAGDGKGPLMYSRIVAIFVSSGIALWNVATRETPARADWASLHCQK